MALSLSFATKIPLYGKPPTHGPFLVFDNLEEARNQYCNVITKCQSKESSKNSQLEIGSPIVLIEAPKLIKTAASVPCLRVNSGLVKPGDVGRIVSRKPKDVWAVRLAIGTYLIDGKYFKPLDLDE